MEGEVITSKPNNNNNNSNNNNPLPWKTRLSLKLLSLITDASRRRDGTINRTISNFFNPKTPSSPSLSSPSLSTTSSDTVVDASRSLWFRLFLPSPPSLHGQPIDHAEKDGEFQRRLGGGIASLSLPLIVFFHGGGFAYLSADSKAYDAVCRRFANEVGAAVVSVDYRLAPEWRYPAQFDDGFDVLRFLDGEKGKKVLKENNVDLSRCFLAGDSAGANIAHHVAVRAAQSTFSTLKVIGLVSIQPFFGGEERTDAELRLTQLVSVDRTDWLWQAFLPEPEYRENGGRDHSAINVSGPRALDISGLHNFPATIVFVGGLDALQDWQRRYYNWLKKSGKEASLVEYPTMCHAFYIFHYLPESGQLISQVAQFVKSVSPK